MSRSFQRCCVEGSFKQLNGLKCQLSLYTFYSTCIRTDGKLNNCFQQTKDVPTGLLGISQTKDNAECVFLYAGLVTYFALQVNVAKDNRILRDADPKE